MSPIECQLYALLHTGNPGDVQFYIGACAGAKTVLELGSGAGRVTLPLARAGLAVTGLELSAPMQALAARANGVTWLTGDMRNFELQQRFDRILLPNNVLFCLLSVEDVKACLRQVVKHLAPGGRVVLDVYRADPDPDTEADDVDEAEPVAELELGGVVYDVFEKSAWDSEPQRLQVTYVHAPRGGGELVSYDIPQRYLTEHELDSLLAEAGLRVLERWGGFQGEAPDEDAETLVRIAELG